MSAVPLISGPATAGPAVIAEANQAVNNHNADTFASSASSTEISHSQIDEIMFDLQTRIDETEFKMKDSAEKAFQAWFFARIDRGRAPTDLNFVNPGLETSPLRRIQARMLLDYLTISQSDMQPWANELTIQQEMATTPLYLSSADLPVEVPRLAFDDFVHSLAANLERMSPQKIPYRVGHINRLANWLEVYEGLIDPQLDHLMCGELGIGRIRSTNDFVLRIPLSKNPNFVFPFKTKMEYLAEYEREHLRLCTKQDFAYLREYQFIPTNPHRSLLFVYSGEFHTTSLVQRVVVAAHKALKRTWPKLHGMSTLHMCLSVPGETDTAFVFDPAELDLDRSQRKLRSLTFAVSGFDLTSQYQGAPASGSDAIRRQFELDNIPCVPARELVINIVFYDPQRDRHNVGVPAPAVSGTEDPLLSAKPQHRSLQLWIKYLRFLMDLVKPNPPKANASKPHTVNQRLSTLINWATNANLRLAVDGLAQHLKGKQEDSIWAPAISELDNSMEEVARATNEANVQIEQWRVKALEFASYCFFAATLADIGYPIMVRGHPVDLIVPASIPGLQEIFDCLSVIWTDLHENHNLSNYDLSTHLGHCAETNLIDFLWTASSVKVIAALKSQPTKQKKTNAVSSNSNSSSTADSYSSSAFVFSSEGEHYILSTPIIQSMSKLQFALPSQPSLTTPSSNVVTPSPGLPNDEIVIEPPCAVCREYAIHNLELLFSTSFASNPDWQELACVKNMEHTRHHHSSAVAGRHYATSLALNTSTFAVIQPTSCSSPSSPEQ